MTKLTFARATGAALIALSLSLAVPAFAFDTGNNDTTTTYLLSFFVIASFWFAHRAKFNSIVKTDGRLMWINMLFLLTMGLVPFTTNLIAESGGTLSTIIYAATMVISGLSLAWLWGHAVRNQMVDPNITPEERSRQLTTTLLTAAVFGISIPLSVAHADVAKYFWISIVPINFLLRILAVRRWKREHPGKPFPTRGQVSADKHIVSPRAD